MVFRCSTAAALALSLTLAACGSGDAETAQSETGGSETAQADTAQPTTAQSETAESETADAESAAPAADEPGAADDLLSPTADLLAVFELEPTPELLDCLAERGVGEEVSVDASLGEVSAALMGCAPEEMGTFMAEGVIVEGLDEAQIECVVVETARAAGGLSPEEARSAFESPSAEIPEGIRTAVLDTAPSACDLTTEEVERVLAAQ